MARSAAVIADWALVVLFLAAVLSMLALLTSLLRVLSLGLWRGARTLVIDRFVREAVSPVPLHFRDVEFAAMPSTMSGAGGLYHSGLYQELWALDRIAQFMAKCYVRDFRLRDQVTYVEQWAGVLHHANVARSFPDPPSELTRVPIGEIREMFEWYTRHGGDRFHPEQYEDAIVALIRSGYLRIEVPGVDPLVTVDHARAQAAFDRQRPQRPRTEGTPVQGRR